MDDGGGGGGIIGLLFGLVMFAVLLGFIVFCILGNWKMYEKAGKPGWACIVPVYQSMVLAEIIGLPNYYGLAVLVPFLNIVFGIYALYKLPMVFGQSPVLGLLCLVPVVNIFAIVYLIWTLGYGTAQYQGAA